MNVRTMLNKLEERARQYYEVLRLPDGSEVRYTGEDALDALCALMDQEDHWLLPHLRRAGTRVGLPGLIWAMEGGPDGS
jgi:hypothetical protein